MKRVFCRNEQIRKKKNKDKSSYSNEDNPFSLFSGGVYPLMPPPFSFFLFFFLQIFVAENKNKDLVMLKLISMAGLLVLVGASFPQNRKTPKDVNVYFF